MNIFIALILATTAHAETVTTLLKKIEGTYPGVSFGPPSMGRPAAENLMTISENEIRIRTASRYTFTRSENPCGHAELQLLTDAQLPEDIQGQTVLTCLDLEKDHVQLYFVVQSDRSIATITVTGDHHGLSSYNFSVQSLNKPRTIDEIHHLDTQKDLFRFNPSRLPRTRP